MLKKYPQFSFAFAIIFFVEIIAISSGLTTLRYFSKPLICISLGLFVFLTLKKKTKFSKRILAGLFFSLWGDIFLMLPGDKKLFFMLGLGSFLVAHLFYISAFYLDSIRKTEETKKSYIIPIFLVFGFFCLSYYAYLYPYLGTMRIPVMLYCFIISLMAIMASLRYGKTNSKSFAWILTGAVLFIVSDSTLAYNKFVENFDLGGLLVMITYMAAQFLISMGCVERTFVKKN